MSARPTELEWERMAVRMIYKVCPAKDAHSVKTGRWEVQTTYCQGCGISESDYRRFIVGDEGKRPAEGKP